MWFKKFKNKEQNPAPQPEFPAFAMPRTCRDGFNVVRAEDLLAVPDNAELLKKVSLAVGGDAAQFDTYLYPAIKACAHLVQLLAAAAPESPTGHHIYKGGLLRHLLETMLFCINEGRSVYVTANVLPAQRESHRQAFVLGCALLGLTHDLGKVYDQEIFTVTASGTEIMWDPREPLPEFLSRVHHVPIKFIYDKEAPRYQVRKWLPRRGGRHALYTAFILRAFCPPPLLAKLYTVSPDLMREFMGACLWSELDKGFYKSDDNRFSCCLRHADAASCQWDATVHQRTAPPVNIKTPEVYAAVASIFKHFISDGTLLINKSRGDCLLFTSGTDANTFKLFLRTDTVLDYLVLNKFRQHLLTQLRSDIFKDASVSAFTDLLSEVGIIEPTDYLLAPACLTFIDADDPFAKAHPTLTDARLNECHAVAFKQISDVIDLNDYQDDPQIMAGFIHHRCKVLNAAVASQESIPTSSDNYQFISEGLEASATAEPLTAEKIATSDDVTADLTSPEPQITTDTEEVTAPLELLPEEDLPQAPLMDDSGDYHEIQAQDPNAAQNFIAALMQDVVTPATATEKIVNIEEAAEFKDAQYDLKRTTLRLWEESVRCERMTLLNEKVDNYMRDRSLPATLHIPELPFTIDLNLMLNLTARQRGEILTQYYAASVPEPVRATLQNLISAALDPQAQSALQLLSYDGISCVAAIAYPQSNEKQASLKKLVRTLRKYKLTANSEDADNFNHELHYFNSVQLLRPVAFILLTSGVTITPGKFRSLPFAEPPNKPTSKDIFLFFKYHLLMLKPGDKLYGCKVRAADFDATVRTISYEAVNNCAHACNVQLRQFKRLLLPSEQKSPPVMLMKNNTLIVYPYVPEI